MPETSSSSSSSQTVATFFERWDVSVFDAIAELPLELEDIIDEINMSPDDHKVDYHTGKFCEGRIYGRGFQSVPEWIRRLCAHKYYIEVGIVNCGPTLFSQVLAMNGVAVPPLLQLYVDDPQAMFHLIRQFEPLLTEGDMKILLLQILHGGPAPQIDPLISFKSQMHRAVVELVTRRPKYDIMYREAENEYNHLGSFIARVWQEVEHRVLMIMIDYFMIAKGKAVGAPLFDRFLLEKHDDPDITGAENAVFQLTGFRVKLVQKPMTPTHEDYTRLWASDHSTR